MRLYPLVQKKNEFKPRENLTNPEKEIDCNDYINKKKKTWKAAEILNNTMEP